MNDDTEQITAYVRLTQHVVNRIWPFGLGTLYERPAKADLLDFIGRYTVPGNMFYPVLCPDKLVDLHLANCTAVPVVCQSENRQA
jgi:hypothetical protein